MYSCWLVCGLRALDVLPLLIVALPALSRLLVLSRARAFPLHFLSRGAVALLFPALSLSPVCALSVFPAFSWRVDSGRSMCSRRFPLSCCCFPWYSPARFLSARALDMLPALPWWVDCERCCFPWYSPALPRGALFGAVVLFPRARCTPGALLVLSRAGASCSLTLPRALLSALSCYPARYWFFPVVGGLRALLLLLPVGGGARWRSLWCCWITPGAFSLPVAGGLRACGVFPRASRSCGTLPVLCWFLPARSLRRYSPCECSHSPGAGILLRALPAPTLPACCCSRFPVCGAPRSRDFPLPCCFPRGYFLLSTPRSTPGAASLWRSLLRALFFPTRLTLPALSSACFLCGRFCSWVVGTGLLPACASPWFPAGLSCVSPRWLDIGALFVTGRLRALLVSPVGGLLPPVWWLDCRGWALSGVLRALLVLSLCVVVVLRVFPVVVPAVTPGAGLFSRRAGVGCGWLARALCGVARCWRALSVGGLFPGALPAFRLTGISRCCFLPPGAWCVLGALVPGGVSLPVRGVLVARCWRGRFPPGGWYSPCVGGGW